MKSNNRQHGVTLITALIMLIILTLLVLSGIRASNTNLRIAGNMQLQEEAVAATQQAIEQVISADFTVNPASAAIAIDIDHNGSIDYTANILVPNCHASISVLSSELNEGNPEDAPCWGSSTESGSQAFGPGNTPSPTTKTWCKKQQWDIRANVTDNSTGASTTLHQGIYLRTETGIVCI